MSWSRSVTLPSRAPRIQRRSSSTRSRGHTMPKFLETDAQNKTVGVYPSAESRDVQRYCPLYQQDVCDMGGVVVDATSGKPASCALGLHRCAATFRGGRICHGTHPALTCNFKKRHWKPGADAAVADTPEPKKVKLKPKCQAKPPEPKATPPTENVAQPSGAAQAPTTGEASASSRVVDLTGPPPATDSRIMDDLMDELIKQRQRSQGHRTNPERPTMVAKVRAIGGELWLGRNPPRIGRYVVP